MVPGQSGGPYKIFTASGPQRTVLGGSPDNLGTKKMAVSECPDYKLEKRLKRPVPIRNNLPQNFLGHKFPKIQHFGNCLNGYYPGS